MMRMKPRIDREQVLRLEAQRRALTLCTARIPELLREHETVTEPVREDDRIVLQVVPKPETAP